jgi:hypothetical protein
LGQEIQRVLAQQQLVREEEILKRQTGKNPGTQSKGPKAETPRRPGCHVFRAQIERRTENMARIKTNPLGRRVMALFLATIMCVSLVQISAFAAETSAQHVPINGSYWIDAAAMDWTDGTAPIPLKTAINALSADGGTNMDAGLRVAYNLLKPGNVTAGIDNRSCIFLTDGEPTFYYSADSVPRRIRIPR